MEYFTIKQWLQGITDSDIRYQTLDNHSNDPIKNQVDRACSSLHEAIQHAFDWSDSPEGDTFWRRLNNDIEKGISDIISIPTSYTDSSPEELLLLT